MFLPHKILAHNKNTIAYIVFGIATTFLFWDILASGGHLMFGLSGDIAKNTFTYLYHIQNDEGLLFEGMNYPYGEHVIFTDNQPLISVPLAFLNNWLQMPSGKLLALMYWLIAISYWIGMVYTYKILRTQSVSWPIAVVAACSILFLSPQSYRIAGHFGLSYACFLPILFYLNLLYYRTGCRKYLIPVFFLTVSFAFLHMYFLAIALIWLCGYILGYIITVKNRWQAKTAHLLYFALSIVSALLTITVFLKITDTASDRPTVPNPEYIHDNILSLVFTSIISPLWQGIQKTGLINNIKSTTDDPAYLGLATMIMIGCGGAIWIISKIRRKSPGFNFGIIWLIIAAVAITYALTINYLLEIEVFKKVLSPLRQFRSPARLSWIFYYVMAIYAAVMLNHLVTRARSNGKRVFSVILLVAVLGIWLIEANGNAIFLKERVLSAKSNYDEFFIDKGDSWKIFLSKNNESPSNFQAILALPYVHVGSEKLWTHENQTRALDHAYRAAIDLRLPLMDVMMSRTSWSQTFRQVTIASGIHGSKPTLREVMDKPILVLRDMYDQLDPDEEALLNWSSYLGDFDGCKVYSFSPKKFLRNQKRIKDSLITTARKINPSLDTVLEDKLCFIDHYNEKKSDNVLAGTGALKVIPGSRNTILEWEVPARFSRRMYEFSTWSTHIGNNREYIHLAIVLKDSGRQELQRLTASGKYSVDNNGDNWFRVHLFFDVPENCRFLCVEPLNDKTPGHFVIDETLIRPAESTVISKDTFGKIFVNNHRYE